MCIRDSPVCVCVCVCCMPPSHFTRARARTRLLTTGIKKYKECSRETKTYNYIQCQSKIAKITNVNIYMNVRLISRLLIIEYNAVNEVQVIPRHQ